MMVNPMAVDPLMNNPITTVVPAVHDHETHC